MKLYVVCSQSPHCNSQWLWVSVFMSLDDRSWNVSLRYVKCPKISLCHTFFYLISVFFMHYTSKYLVEGKANSVEWS